MIKVSTLMITICALSIAGCGGSDSDERSPQSDSIGNLSGVSDCVQTEESQTLLCGTALAADGTTPLVGAEITLESSASNIEFLPELMLRGIASSTQCLTDSQGQYACVLPDTLNGIVRFQLAADGFDNQVFEVNVQAGEVSEVQTQILSADATIQWAVVPGSFDGIQVLLAQLKGCTLNDPDGNPWVNTNPDPSSARGSTDCESKGLRVVEPDDTAFYTDGSLDLYDALYVNCDADLSERADINAAIKKFSEDGKHVYFSDLSDVWLDAVFPDKINFAGNETNTNPDFEADVVDEQLAAVVGERINLVFDYIAWTAIDSVSADTTVYIEGDISESSIYEGVKPITVGFKNQSSDGCVFFTSYHIEGASVGSDQELAIKYLIQNIDKACI